MDKHVDESWKDATQKEKETVSQNGQRPAQFESNFNTLVSGIAMEGLIFLGEITNPVTKKKEESLEQAKYVIDTLSLLKEKTKGNLTAEEANGLDNILYELRTKFVAKNR